MLTVMAAVAIAVGVIGAVFVLSDGDGTTFDPEVASSHVQFIAGEQRFGESAVRAVAGEVTIDLVNTASGAHDLAVMRSGVTLTRSVDFDATLSLGKVDWTAPRSTSSVTLTLEPGTYQVVCTLPGHVEAGMTSLLIVEEAPSP